MVRRTLNASRLQEEVSRRLRRLPEVVEDGVRIGVPRPQLQAPDAGGCNWTMKHFGNAAGFEAAIAEVLARTRADYNLAVGGEEGDEREAAADDASAAGDPFGGPARARAAANPFGESKPVKRANPFGESGAPERANPFGDAQREKDGNPFTRTADDDAGEPRNARSRDPFAGD